jgi:hypothetical protein
MKTDIRKALVETLKVGDEIVISREATGEQVALGVVEKRTSGKFLKVRLNGNGIVTFYANGLERASATGVSRGLRMISAKRQAA